MTDAQLDELKLYLVRREEDLGPVIKCGSKSFSLELLHDLRFLSGGEQVIDKLVLDFLEYANKAYTELV